MHLAHLHAWKDFYTARYPMHQQDFTIRRFILLHSEGGIFTSRHPFQGALFILLEMFEGGINVEDTPVAEGYLHFYPLIGV